MGREPLQPPPIPAGVMAGDGMPWPRLATGISLLVLALVFGDPAGRRAPRGDAVPQPVRESAVTAVELAPLDGVPAAAPLPASSAAAPQTTAALEGAGHAAPAPVHPSPHVRIAAKRARMPALHRHRAAPSARGSAASGRGVRTRAQVRREYLRDRDVVAALTGEDSGSAYLSRVAAQRRSRRGPR